MATAPTNTYGSSLSLALGHVPDVDDPTLYRELLDIHNAIEALVTHADGGGTAFLEFQAKFRNNTAVSADYTILISDGTIEVDASAGDIDITLPLVADGIGYRYDIKRVDDVFANKVILDGDTSVTPELIDAHTGGIQIDPRDSFTVKANEAQDGWNII